MPATHKNGIVLASISAFNGIAKASVSAVNGLTIAASDPGPQYTHQAHPSNSAGALDFYEGMDITLSVSGYATEIWVYIGISAGGGGDLKGGLFDSSGTRLASAAAVTVPSPTTAYVVLALSSHPAVTSGQTYKLRWAPSNGNLSSGYEAGAGSGEYKATTYATFPPATITAGTLFAALYDAALNVAAAP